MPATPHILYLSPRLRGAMTKAESDALAIVTHACRAYDLAAYRALRHTPVSLTDPLGFAPPIIPADDDDGMPPPVAPAMPVPVQQAA